MAASRLPDFPGASRRVQATMAAARSPEGASHASRSSAAATVAQRTAKRHASASERVLSFDRTGDLPRHVQKPPTGLARTVSIVAILPAPIAAPNERSFRAILGAVIPAQQ